MKRFEVISGSKFERLSYTEMAQSQENIPTFFPMR